jgi:hypothetical protein
MERLELCRCGILGRDNEDEWFKAFSSLKAGARHEKFQ